MRERHENEPRGRRHHQVRASDGSLVLAGQANAGERREH
jgi:hypothetical protein